MELIKSFATKFREQIMYGIFGCATTIVNWVVYTLSLYIFSLSVSNALAWFIAVLFAYFVNKKYVFESKYVSVKHSIREVFLFYGGRVFSGIIEVGGLPLLVYFGVDQQVFGIEGSVAKIIISVLVIITNYLIMKFIVFRKKQSFL